MAEADPQIFSKAVFAASTAASGLPAAWLPTATQLARPWTQQRAASDILASLRDTPPACEARFDTYVQTRDEYHAYVDPRVDLLHGMWNAAMQAILHNEASLTRDEFRAAISAQPRVTDAIDATLADVPQITVRCEERDEFLHQLLTLDRALTSAEWAYVEAAEDRAA